MVTHEGRVIYKVNQDKGLISHPSLSDAQHTIFGIFDGECSFVREREKEIGHEPGQVVWHLFRVCGEQRGRGEGAGGWGRGKGRVACSNCSRSFCFV